MIFLSDYLKTMMIAKTLGAILWVVSLAAVRKTSSSR